MEGEPIDCLKGCTVFSANYKMKTEDVIKLEPTIHLDEVRIEDGVSVIKNEWGSSQISFGEVGYGLPKGPLGMEPVMNEKRGPNDAAVNNVAGSENEPFKGLSRNGLNEVGDDCTNEPMQLVLSEELVDPPNQPLHVELNEVQNYYPLQLKTSGMVSQDWGPSRNSDPEITQVEDKVIQCDICSYRTHKKYKYKLREHMNIHTGERPYVCDLCDSTFSRKGYLDRHKLSHSQERPFASSLCEYTAKQKVHWARHMLIHHRNALSNDPLNIDLNEINSECTNDSLRRNEVHDAVTTICQSVVDRFTRDGHYKCCICGFVLSNKNGFEKHIRSHFETEPFECYICTFSTNDKHHITHHMLSHFGFEPRTKPSTASEHAVSTIANSHLSRQMLTCFGLEPGTKPFTCSVCTYSTNKKSHLTRHMLTHSGAKPFACDVCDSRFNRKDSLRKHMKVHKKKIIAYSTGKYVAESDPNSSRHTSGTKASELDQQSNSATASSIEEVDFSMTDRLGPTGVVIEDVVMPGSENRPSKDPSRINGTIQLVVLNNNLYGVSIQRMDVDLCEIKNELVSDPLQLRTIEMGSQDWGPSINSDPERIQAEDNNIQCDICSYSTRKKYKYKLKEHMRIHTGERPFACNLCELTFSRKRNLDQHKLNHSGEFPFACKLCDYTARQKSHLVRHMKTHVRCETSNGQAELNDPNHASPCDPLQIGVSVMNSVNVDDLSKNCGPKIIPTQATHKRFTCDVCSYRSDRKFEFEIHLRTHTGVKPFACDLCDKKYIARKTLNRHWKTHLLEKRCGLCEFSAIRESDLASHMKTHMREKNAFRESRYEQIDEPLQLELREEAREKLFACDFCDKSYAAKTTMDWHIRACHREKLYDCGLCDYITAKKTDLADHIKTHIKNETNDDPPGSEVKRVKDVPPHDSSAFDLNEVKNSVGPSGSTSGINLPEDEQFTCVHCDFGCDDITAWCEHMFKHTNEKSYSCDHCEFKTKNKVSMDVHRTIHTEKMSVGSVKVTCEFCNYPFTTKANMNQHIMTCHSELYISCDVCDFKAFHKRGLELHKATHTMPYTCNNCDYKVDKESLLSRHIMTAHADVAEYACSSCDYKASKIEDVEQHILTTHSSPAAETVPLTCVTAEMPTNEIDVSIPTQPDVKEFMCYACDYKASQIAQVEEHILNAHTTVLMEEISTPVLSSGFAGNQSNAPLSSNSVLEGYSCYTCDYKASDVSQVEHHILTTHNLWSRLLHQQ